MSNYPPNKVVDIHLILDECHKDVYAQRYPNRRLIGKSTILKKKKRSHRNPFHRRRQRNRLQNNNNPGFLTILIHINPHSSICQAERQIGISRATTH